MRSGFYVFIVLIFVSVGCKKFEHGDQTNPSVCELCSMAQSSEGTYRGERWGFNTLTSSYYYDSLTINLEQVFLNNNPYDDSTSIYFRMTTELDSNPGTLFYDTITIKDETGDVWYEKEHAYWIRNDSIYYRKNYTSLGGMQYISYEGLFLKQ